MKDRQSPRVVRAFHAVLDLVTLAAPLSAALVAIVAVPWFVTQDGPAHLYNAHILADTLSPGSAFLKTYDVRWRAIPNWAGHLSLMGLMWILPPRAADRAMMSITLVGLAGSATWLRVRVTGRDGLSAAALWSGSLAMNLLWLYGFYGFLLGACLFPITLGVWWGGRARMGWGRVAGLAALLIAGYFCHPLSLAVTVAGLGILALMTPGPGWLGRLARTVACVGPVLPLVWAYRLMARAGGPIEPYWTQFRARPSLDNLAVPLAWVDPLTLGVGAFTRSVNESSWWRVFQVPLLWAIFLFLATIASDLLRRQRPPAKTAGTTAPDGSGGPGPSGAGRPEMRGWSWLAGLILFGGLAAPDAMGIGHGEYLPQRIVLLGLIALLPVVNLSGPPVTRKLIGVALTAMVAFQSVQVLDYALRSDRMVGELIDVTAGPLGRGRRVGTLLLSFRGPYRANPLLHADCLLGLGTDNILWTNYEAVHYYFPVHFRRDVPHPPEFWFELVSTRDDPANAAPRVELWEALVDRYHNEIDRLIVWNTDPSLDVVTARRFRAVARSAHVRLLAPKKAVP